MTKTYFANNLRYLREKRGLEQLELAERLGRKSASSISEWERGTYEPKSKILSSLAEIFNVSLSDLMTKDLTQPNNIVEVAPQTVRVAILGEIACGDPITAEENIIGYRYLAPESLPSGEVFYLIAKGDSMSPKIPDRARVLIRQQPDVENNEIAAVLINGDTEATLKRVKKVNGQVVLLLADNPDYDPIVVDENNPIRILGKAMRIEIDL